MKKIAITLLTLVLALSLAVPAMAADVDTSVQVLSGNGNPPIIKAKWEAPDTGDPNHTSAGTQILASGQFEVNVPLRFYAVVTDPEGKANIRDVYADVYHPLESPEAGSFKFQVKLAPLGHDAALAAFEVAVAEGLIFFNSPYDEAETRHELEQSLADVYYGEWYLEYHQPWGFYVTTIRAFDNQNNETTFSNHFLYVQLTAAEFDFNALNYGTVEVSSNKVVGGDKIFQSPIGAAPSPNPATVRNIGNSWGKITVKQDDMGFGQTVGQVPPWNVEYDARLSATGVNIVYNPAVAKGGNLAGAAANTLPDILKNCNTEKLDFSIHVKKATAGIYTGKMILGFLFEPFGP
ncbi:MAG: hypothetical protein HYX96_06775 [Chloroflexi bacterium]|nr:hypothetical protein [Chloroflexota bacterium]